MYIKRDYRMPDMNFWENLSLGDLVQAETYIGHYVNCLFFLTSAKLRTCFGLCVCPGYSYKSPCTGTGNRVKLYFCVCVCKMDVITDQSQRCEYGMLHKDLLR